ncbi:ankyrin repeat protein [Lyophyllum atratum]|nr:ankyrin repeat protein [Lyophyllum atratum]
MKNSPDSDGHLPIHLAARAGHAEVVEVLLQPEIDVDSRSSSYGQTPLSYAAENGHVDVVRLLLRDPRVDVHIKDNIGRTALDVARGDDLRELLQSHMESIPVR